MMVGQELVFQVVTVFLKNNCRIKYRLVADVHHSQLIRREATIIITLDRTHEYVAVINAISISHLRRYFTQHIAQLVACAEEIYPVARSLCDAFIHGIVNALIRFADPPEMPAVFFKNSHSSIVRPPIDDDIVHIVVRLIDNTFKRVFDLISSIIAYRYHRYFGVPHLSKCSLTGCLANFINSSIDQNRLMFFSIQASSLSHHFTSLRNFISSSSNRIRMNLAGTPPTML